MHGNGFTADDEPIFGTRGNEDTGRYVRTGYKARRGYPTM